MKKLAIVLAVLATTALLLGLTAVTPASAATTGTIDAQVTLQSVAVTVSPTSIDFGTLDLDTTSTAQAIYAGNAGSANEKFLVYTNSWHMVNGSGAQWALASSRGVNQVRLDLEHGDLPGGYHTYLDPMAAYWYDNALGYLVAPGTEVDGAVRLSMPSSVVPVNPTPATFGVGIVVTAEAY